MAALDDAELEAYIGAHHRIQDRVAAD